MCGGTDFGRQPVNVIGGLSPRVRGNRRGNPALQSMRRSIPACAGEPDYDGIYHLTIMVYPRVCGGTGCPMPSISRMAGLSPRVRGNPGAGLYNADDVGSIPACAGEPPVRCGSQASSKVYPRVCGGTYDDYEDAVHGHGLSPRVRGNHTGAGFPAQCPRSIPACAGEPSTPLAVCRWCAVYPRVCGGTDAPGVLMDEMGGLSPRVRGNPATWTAYSDIATVYPRVCGGTGAGPDDMRGAYGLSPRVRGNRATSPA